MGEVSSAREVRNGEQKVIVGVERKVTVRGKELKCGLKWVCKATEEITDQEATEEQKQEAENLV